MTKVSKFLPTTGTAGRSLTSIEFHAASVPIVVTVSLGIQCWLTTELSHPTWRFERKCSLAGGFTAASSTLTYLFQMIVSIFSGTAVRSGMMAFEGEYQGSCRLGLCACV